MDLREGRFVLDASGSEYGPVTGSCDQVMNF